MLIGLLLFLNFSFMMILPIFVGWWIASRRQIGWGYFGVGVVGFIASQLFHIPFNWLVLDELALLSTDTAVISNLVVLVVFLGLSAGFFEEVTRYLFYRFGMKQARTWGQGLMFGAGWGGIEAMLLGGTGLLNFFVLLGMRKGLFLEIVPADQMGLVQAAIETMFGVPWYLALIGAVERLFALCLHLALALMVMQVFVRQNKVWLLAAILWHAFANATAVFALIYLSPLLGENAAALTSEGFLAVYALLSLGIVFWLKRSEPEPPAFEPLPAVGPTKPVMLEMNEDVLERSKYW